MKETKRDCFGAILLELKVVDTFKKGESVDIHDYLMCESIALHHILQQTFPNEKYEFDIDYFYRKVDIIFL